MPVLTLNIPELLSDQVSRTNEAWMKPYVLTHVVVVIVVVNLVVCFATCLHKMGNYISMFETHLNILDKNMKIGFNLPEYCDMFQIIQVCSKHTDANPHFVQTCSETYPKINCNCNCYYKYVCQYASETI